MGKSEANKQRIEYIDQLKGFAILLVVMGHVFLFSFKVPNNSYVSSWIVAISSFHMPLFAFLSGLFIRSIDSWTRLHKLVERFIIPMIVIGLTYAMWRGIDVVDFMFNKDKFGYWYFLFLLSAYVIITLYERISKAINPRDTVFLHTLLALIFIIGLRMGVGKMPEPAYLLMGWGHLANLMPFIFAGYFLRKYDCFSKIMSNITLFNVATSVFVVFAILRYNGFMQLSIVFSTCTVYVIVALFYRYRDSCNFIKRVLSFWGRHSLEIYCIHYFFIHSCKLPFLYEYTMHRQCSLVELLASALLSSVFCYLSIYVCKLITQSSWMAYICFGQRK